MILLRSFAYVHLFYMLQTSEEQLVVVGGGAAGIYGSIRAKTIAPNLNVVVIEKGKPLSKVCFYWLYMQSLPITNLNTSVRLKRPPKDLIIHKHLLEFMRVSKLDHLFYEIG